MRNYLLIVITILISITCLAQSPTLKWGTTQKSQSGTYSNKLIGRDNEGNTYSLRMTQGLEDAQNTGKVEIRTMSVTTKYKKWIEKYDKDFNLIFSKEVESPKVGKKSLPFLEVVYLNDKITVFSSQYIKSKSEGKRRVAYKFEIGKDGVVNEKSLKEIGAVESFNFQYTGYFEFKVSEDRTKILVVGTKAYYMMSKKFKEVKKNFYCYDKNFNQIWKTEKSYPYKEKDFDVRKRLIDNDGNMAMLVARENKDISDVSNFEIHYFNGESKYFTVHSIDLGQRLAGRAAIYIDNKKKKILVTGFSSNATSEKEVQGFFTRTIDIQKGEVVSSDYKNIETDLLDKLNRMEDGKYFRGDAIAGGKREMRVNSRNQLEVKETYNTADGGNIIVASNYFQDDYHGATSTMNVYGHILIIKVDKNGKIAWWEQVNRFSGDTDKIRSRRNKCYYNFNETKQCLEIIKNDGPTNESSINYFVINSDGKKGVNSFSENKGKASDQVVLLPHHTLKISDNKFVVYGEADNNGKHRLGELIVN